MIDEEIAWLFDHGFKQLVDDAADAEKSGNPMGGGATVNQPGRAETQRRLSKHRAELKDNKNAFRQDFPRLERTVRKHLRQMGYRKLTRDPAIGKDEVRNYIFCIAKAQGFAPFFHVADEGELPYCWNTPEFWHVDYIVYHWGHLYPQSEGELAHRLDNLCLQSARCNLHVQTALHIDDVERWLAGSRIAERIREVSLARQTLFGSDEWAGVLSALKPFRTQQRSRRPAPVFSLGGHVNYAGFQEPEGLRVLPEDHEVHVLGGTFAQDKGLKCNVVRGPQGVPKLFIGLLASRAGHLVKPIAQMFFNAKTRCVHVSTRGDSVGDSVKRGGRMVRHTPIPWPGGEESITELLNSAVEIARTNAILGF